MNAVIISNVLSGTYSQLVEAQQLLFCKVVSKFPLEFEKLENGKSLGF